MVKIGGFNFGCECRCYPRAYVCNIRASISIVSVRDTNDDYRRSCTLIFYLEKNTNFFAKSEDPASASMLSIEKKKKIRIL